MFENSIKLNYITYYKINKKQKLNNIFYYIYILKKYNKLIFNYFNLPVKKKYFVLVKSPKCYKIGKMLINYKYFNFFLKINLNKNLINYKKILIYFYFLKKKYNIYQTIFLKNIKLTIKLNTNYNLKILYDSITYYNFYCD